MAGLAYTHAGRLQLTAGLTCHEVCAHVTDMLHYVLLFFRYDDLPEMAFYMVGDITEVQEKADKMAKEIAARRVRRCFLMWFKFT
jgi:hypothetical protein